MYGERYGTGTLAKALKDLAYDIYQRLDNGADYEELRDDARRLVGGAMELWERFADDGEDA